MSTGKRRGGVRIPRPHPPPRPQARTTCLAVLRRAFLREPKRRRQARPQGVPEREDLEADALAWIAEIEADAEALEADSDGEDWG